MCAHVHACVYAHVHVSTHMYMNIHRCVCVLLFIRLLQDRSSQCDVPLAGAERGDPCQGPRQNGV